MSDHAWLAERFEDERGRLRAVAYRMLGSVSDADDAVQEAWLRLSRSDTAAITNLAGWLTTVVGRVCLDMLRAGRARPEEPVGVQMPEPVVGPDEGAPDPEHEALLSDSVSLALLVVLETLAPAERLAFVLHDMFGVPFREIGPLVDRSPDAAKMLASRARHRVRGASLDIDPDPARQREVVTAFLAATRGGDLGALLALLDPDVALRADVGGGRPLLELHGPTDVAPRASRFSRLAADVRPIRVNGGAGLVAFRDGRPYALLGFTVRGGRIAEIDILADAERLARLDLDFLGDE